MRRLLWALSVALGEVAETLRLAFHGGLFDRDWLTILPLPLHGRLRCKRCRLAFVRQADGNFTVSPCLAARQPSLGLFSARLIDCPRSSAMGQHPGPPVSLPVDPRAVEPSRCFRKDFTVDAARPSEE